MADLAKNKETVIQFFEQIWNQGDESAIDRFIAEDAAGNDLVWGFVYDGEEVDNEGGGDTNGKGYYAWTWEQEF